MFSVQERSTYEACPNKKLKKTTIKTTSLDGVVQKVETIVLEIDRDEMAIISTNNFRRQHSAADLVNDLKIEKVAQECADYLAKENKFEHRKNPKYGENLAKSGSAEESSAAQRWYDEIEYYKFPNKDNLFFHGSGHFTQLIWKGSQRVGVGVARTNGCTIVVANYDPPGNILGHFYENVLPKK